MAFSIAATIKLHPKRQINKLTFIEQNKGHNDGHET